MFHATSEHLHTDWLEVSVLITISCKSIFSGECGEFRRSVSVKLRMQGTVYYYVRLAENSNVRSFSRAFHPDATCFCPSYQYQI